MHARGRFAGDSVLERSQLWNWGGGLSLTRIARPSWEPPEAKLCEAGRGGRLLLLRSFPARFPGSLGSAKSRSSCQRAGLASVDAPRLRAREVCWVPAPEQGQGFESTPRGSLTLRVQIRGF